MEAALGTADHPGRPIAGELNRAAERGPQTFAWWKDWRGQASAIIASGPSVNRDEVAKLRGRLRVIAIKENACELAPWADVAYGCDWHWWRHRQGLKDFQGVKIGFDPKIAQRFPDVQTIRIKETGQKPKQYSFEILLDEPGLIGGGGNSGFQSFNIDLQFGSTQILLVGFDMQGTHWYGRNSWHGSHNPEGSSFRRWCRAFDSAAEVCRRLGIDVVNASPTSALTCFRKASIEDALRGWGL